ncbi:MAG: response regulator [Thermoplasmatota archaeon]
MNPSDNTNGSVPTDFYTILVVDDDESILDLLKQLLETNDIFDCAVSTVETAEEAEKDLQERRYDLIITDQKLPGTNGTEFLSKVKDRYPKTVRMLITGYSDLDIAKEAINKAEVHSFIEKPWDNKELIDKIYENLKKMEESTSESDIYKPRDVRESITKIESTIEDGLPSSSQDFSRVSALGGINRDASKSLTFEFDSVSDFNKFPFELKHMDLEGVDVRIEDFRVYSDRYRVTISLSKG